MAKKGRIEGRVRACKEVEHILSLNGLHSCGAKMFLERALGSEIEVLGPVLQDPWHLEYRNMRRKKPWVEHGGVYTHCHEIGNFLLFLNYFCYYYHCRCRHRDLSRTDSSIVAEMLDINMENRGRFREIQEVLKEFKETAVFLSLSSVDIETQG